MNFEDSRRKAQFVYQHKCKCSDNKRWWGTIANNKCRNCQATVKPLDLKEMVGVGWFECRCERRYARFCRGDVTSKCHGCNKENYPSFIV